MIRNFSLENLLKITLNNEPYPLQEEEELDRKREEKPHEPCNPLLNI